MTDLELVERLCGLSLKMAIAERRILRAEKELLDLELVLVEARIDHLMGKTWEPEIVTPGYPPDGCFELIEIPEIINPE